MGLMDTLRERAAARPMRVAFPEGDNETMMRAVAELTEAGLAKCVLVGDGAELAHLAAERGISLEGIEVVDVTDEEANAACAERYLAHPDCKYKPKGVARRMTRPLERADIARLLQLGQSVRQCAARRAVRQHALQRFLRQLIRLIQRIVANAAFRQQHAAQILARAAHGAQARNHGRSRGKSDRHGGKRGQHRP